jgi:hypothetical protein
MDHLDASKRTQYRASSLRSSSARILFELLLISFLSFTILLPLFLPLPLTSGAPTRAAARKERTGEDDQREKGSSEGRRSRIFHCANRRRACRSRPPEPPSGAVRLLPSLPVSMARSACRRRRVAIARVEHMPRAASMQAAVAAVSLVEGSRLGPAPTPRPPTTRAGLARIEAEAYKPRLCLRWPGVRHDLLTTTISLANRAFTVVFFSACLQ